MSPTATGALQARQLWNLPTSTDNFSDRTRCTPLVLPVNGVLSLAGTVITLTTSGIFTPECTGAVAQGVHPAPDDKDPFYASTIPQTYVMAAATVLAWVLVVMLIITPRTSFFGHLGVSPGFSNGHGIIGGATGSGPSLIGIGSRPWLQNVATLTVAISLTIATADTFKVAQEQYAMGYMDATHLRDRVMGSIEIRVTRVISDVFLWLAQVQTLVRLFPRHKEKVLIKWIGFALIIFDSTFSCLNSFLINNDNRPRHFVDAIPALSYLFELALGLLYAAWVIYYALTKRRYAFYHYKMRNICLIALLSLIAILTPVVFFVTDVSNQDVAGWGDYFRWVGAAAASVVVWEWVERIEALERDEKKDGILGREVFDGDEMLDMTPSEEWNDGKRGRDNPDALCGNQSSALEHGLSGVAQRFRRNQQQRNAEQHYPLGGAHSIVTTATRDNTQTTNGNPRIAFGHLPKPTDEQQVQGGRQHITPPPAIATSVSRADITSAASTVYVVRYDTMADAPQPVRRQVPREASDDSRAAQVKTQAKKDVTLDEDDVASVGDRNRSSKQQGRWHGVSNPFKRKRASPPAEVQHARQNHPQHLAAPDTASLATVAATPAHYLSRWDVKNRLGVLAVEARDRVRDRAAGRRQVVVDMPLTIIPAQPRGSGRTWSPQAVRESTGPTNPGEDEENSPQTPVDRTSDSTTLTANSDFVAAVAGSPSVRGTHDAILGAEIASAPRPTAVPSPSRASTVRPPRSGDVGTSSGGAGGIVPTIIVPAPRRSPLHMSTSATSNSPTRSPSGDARQAGDHG